MIIENIFPVLMWCSPPTTLEQAAKRISEASGSLLDAPMTKLVGSVFLNLEQLTNALSECKLKYQISFLMKSGPIKTVKLVVENIHTGTIYHLIVTEYPRFLLTHNVKLITAPNEKPEDVEAFKLSLEEEEIK